MNKYLFEEVKSLKELVLDFGKKIYLCFPYKKKKLFLLPLINQVIVDCYGKLSGQTGKFLLAEEKKKR